MIRHDLERLPPLQRNRGIRKFQRGCHSFGHGQQFGLGRERGLQPSAEARENRHRLVAFAVHQTVHSALKPLAQWLEQDGDQAGGSNGKQGRGNPAPAAARLKQRAERADY